MRQGELPRLFVAGIVFAAIGLVLMVTAPGNVEDLPPVANVEEVIPEDDSHETQDLFVADAEGGDIAALSQNVDSPVNDGYEFTTVQGANHFSLFLDQLRMAAKENGKPEHPVIQEFRAVVHRDVTLRTKMERMINKAYIRVPGHVRGPRLARSLKEYFELLNAVLTRAPKPARDFLHDGASLRTFPMSAVLSHSNTKQGDAVYRDPNFNHMIGKVLHAWNEFLNSPASAYVLNDKDGWLAAPDIDFSLYVHDKTKPHWGFSSFNDFFTRQFVSGVRPAAPGADVAVSAVESHVTRFGHGLKAHQFFCVKGEHYSLVDMLAGHKQLVSSMVGGSLIQAFLSPTHYHRFHAPVAGTIVTADVIPGLYFSENCPVKNHHDLLEARNETQAGYETYLSNVQTRGIIAIQTKQHGLVVVIPIGMSEVSSVKMFVKPGDHVQKSEQLGMFQFGGSTCVVMFQKGVVENFVNATGAKYQPRDSLKIGQHMALLKHFMN